MKSFIAVTLLLISIMMSACSRTNRINSILSDSRMSVDMQNSHIGESSSSNAFVDFTPYELCNYAPEHWENKIYPRPKTVEDIFIYDYPPKRDVNVAEEDVIQVDGMNADMLPVITNTPPLVELMSPMYPGAVHELFENGDSRGGMDYNLAEYKDIFPISFLRKTGKGRYYTVNKVYDGGYAYIFFERPRDSQSADKRYMTDDETDIVMTGCIYAEDLLYKSDFNGIQIGDTMEDVLEVDHAMVLPMQFCSWNEDIYGFKKENYITKHFLRDGVLVISYAVNASKDDYTITAIEYFSDSIFIANDYFDPMDQGYPKNYSILPQDYPPET